ncbi:MAG: hypothetical protein JW860_06365 [Sedimentisphaerales bacterium]|nr:hypothetical protein [Sedimentisphaerales bacterium]
MFDVDLLKGHGVPIKSKPGGTFLVAISFIVPVAIASVLLGNYLRNRIILYTQNQMIQDYNSKISHMEARLKNHELAQKHKETLIACCEEVGDVVHLYTQWTPVLLTLIEYMPDKLKLDQLTIKKNDIKINVPSRKNPDVSIPIVVPRRTMEIHFHGNIQDDLQDLVNEFRYNMRFATMAKAKILDILPGSTIVDEKNNTIHYTFDCIFEMKE